MRSLCLFLLVVAIVPAGAASFTVLDGSQQAVIVYQKDADKEAKQAYEDLALYLKRSTGQDFKVVSERAYDAKQGLPIYVGWTAPTNRALGTKLRRLDRDAYLVSVTPERIMLAGPTPWSTYWAVCQFLEDIVGVRWLIPGPLGEDVPHCDRVVAPVGERTYAPVMLSRLWSGAHHGGVWNLRQRIHGRYNFHHNLLNIFTPKKYWDTHPEYFPMHGTERYKPGGSEDNSWQPCMGIEGTVQVAADAAREAFRNDPSLESFSYGMNDGAGWCECPACKAIDKPMPSWHGFSGDKSVLFYSWLNRIAENLEEDYPDKKLGCLAYSAAILPPPGLKLHRNIIPYFTSNRADYFDPAFRQQDQRMVAWWAEHTTQMGIYDYAYGVGFGIPRIYNHLFQTAVQYAVAHKVKGFYAEVYPNWGLDGHKLYVMSRIVWNPHVNVDAITQEWNERMFRAAAPPMQRYFQLAEDAWRHQEGHGAWAYRLAADPAQFAIFTPQIMAEMTGCLDEATKLAESDVVKQRIEFFRKTFEITRILGNNYWAGAEVAQLIEKKAPMEQVAAAMRAMIDKLSTSDIDTYMRDVISKDPIAYFPPLAGWFEPLKAGAMTNATRYFAATVANDAVAMARKQGKLDGATIRANIDQRVGEVFGSGGSPQYQETVRRMRDMALKVGAAAKADGPMKADGVLDEPVWQRADVLTDFVNWGSTAPATELTKIRLAYEGKNLYVAMECLQDTKNLVTEAAARDGNTWKDDSIEVFVNKGMEAAPLAQFILNAAGAFYDRYDKDGTQDYAGSLAYNFKADWGAKVYPDKWTGEVRIPLDELGLTPAPDSLIRMNFVRNAHVGKDTHISAWFSSLRAHADPLSRGWILFE